VCLNLTLPPDELKNDDDYRDIIQDVQEECAKSGCLYGYTAVCKHQSLLANRCLVLWTLTARPWHH
jgi:hypothetical protein